MASGGISQYYVKLRCQGTVPLDDLSFIPDILLVIIWGLCSGAALPMLRAVLLGSDLKRISSSTSFDFQNPRQVNITTSRIKLFTQTFFLVEFHPRYRNLQPNFIGKRLDGLCVMALSEYTPLHCARCPLANDELHDRTATEEVLKIH
jgi:hypothetical protein